MPASLTDQQHHSAFTLLGLTPAAAQQLELLFAPDQRGERDLVLRLEPAFDRAFGYHLTSVDRFLKAFERNAAKLAVVEMAAGQSPRARRDDQRAGLRQGLQAGGEIGGFADDAPLLGLARAGQIADDNETSGDADADLQARLGGQLQPRHRCDQCQSGADRPLGIVFMGSRISEIGQHPVAHIFGDEALEASDNLGDSAMVGADDVAQILGIETRGQGRRPDQIAKHDGQLPPLCLGRRPSVCGR